MHLWGTGKTDTERKSSAEILSSKWEGKPVLTRALYMSLSNTYIHTHTFHLTHIYIHKISRSVTTSHRDREEDREKDRQTLHIPITQSFFRINTVFVCFWQSWAHCLVKLHRSNLFSLWVRILQVFNHQWNPEQCILWQVMAFGITMHSLALI